MQERMVKYKFAEPTRNEAAESFSTELDRIRAIRNRNSEISTG